MEKHLKGLGPLILRLQIECSANWATGAKYTLSIRLLLPDTVLSFYAETSPHPLYIGLLWTVITWFMGSGGLPTDFSWVCNSQGIEYFDRAQPLSEEPLVLEFPMLCHFIQVHGWWVSHRRSPERDDYHRAVSDRTTKSVSSDSHASARLDITLSDFAIL